MPTLSQVQTLNTGYLREAAQHWTHTAKASEQAFTEVHQRLSAPGGIPWKGRAAAAAEERSYLDLVKVREASDQLHGAAALALRGGEQLQAWKEAVLEAVDDARADGFYVGEDYSVTDRSSGGTQQSRAARQAAAERHASFIRHRVAALLAGDQQVTARITAAMNGIDTLSFPGQSSTDDAVAGDDDQRRVQAVDRRTGREPAGPAVARRWQRRRVDA